MPTRSRRPLPEERGNDARDDFPVGSAFRLGDDLRHYDLRVLWAFGTGLADHSLPDLLALRLGRNRGQEEAHRVTTEGLSGTHRGHKIALEPLLQLRAYAPSSASALAALRFLALAACGRPLVELAAAGLGEDSGLLDLLVESAKRCLKRLAITNDHFRQRLLVTPPS